MRSPYGRLCPPFLACLDELPSTTPLPTLRTRMANERALGLSFIYATQTWRQLVICYGENEARAMFGLTNNLVIFGGGKDAEFYKEVSELLGTTRIVRRSYNHSRPGWSSSLYCEDVPILRSEDIRQLPDRRALVVAESVRTLIARLSRCIDGKAGRSTPTSFTSLPPSPDAHGVSTLGVVELEASPRPRVFRPISRACEQEIAS